MLQILTLLANTAPAEEAQGLAALGIDPLTILAQGVTFVIFFLIIKKFAFTKVVDTLEKRRTTIEESLNKAEELHQQNEDAEKRVSALLHEARTEADTIIGKSHEEAGSIIQEAEDAAVNKAEKIIADGKLQIENEVIKAREALKKETLTLVAEATEAVLGERVDIKKHEALVRKALSESKK